MKNRKYLIWSLLCLINMPVFAQEISSTEVVYKNNYLVLGAVGIVAIVIGYLIGRFFGSSQETTLPDGRTIVSYEKQKLSNERIDTISDLDGLQAKCKQITNEKNEILERLEKTENELKDCRDQNIMLVESQLKLVGGATPSQVNNTNPLLPCKCIKEGEQFFLKREQSKNHNTLYLVQENQNGGYSYTLDLNNKQAIQNAMNYSEILIEGCCDVENNYSSMYTSVQIIGNSKGKLKLDGDKFKIVEKIKIKFV